MHMHLNDACKERMPVRPEPAALVFRAVLRGAAQVLWRNRCVRLDEDTWLVLDGREACELQPDPESGVEAVEIDVTAELRDAGLTLAAQTLVAGESPGAGRVAELAAMAFADNLHATDGPAGRRLLGIARARALGRPPVAQGGEIVELVAACAGEELELRRRAARIGCVKVETREQLLRRIRLAADFIATHHDESISLEEMARAASLSRFHFVRLFNLVHGETPHAFLLKKRIAVARRHLAIGGACREAATRAGFGSRSALFRNLRKVERAGSALAASTEPCFPSA
jgi:AraC-like DNA-binding protein